jgi:hypothetical protein
MTDRSSQGAVRASVLPAEAEAGENGTERALRQVLQGVLGTITISAQVASTHLRQHLFTRAVYSVTRGRRLMTTAESATFHRMLQAEAFRGDRSRHSDLGARRPGPGVDLVASQGSSSLRTAWPRATAAATAPSVVAEDEPARGATG